MTTKDEEKVLDDLVGVVLSPRATGGHQIDRNKITAPLEGKEDGMATRVFCKGCGIIVEVNQKSAELLAEMAGGTLPTDLTGWYFETGECLICSSKFIDVCLKKI